MASGGDYLDVILAELKRGRKQWRRGDKLLEAFGYIRRRQTAIDWINEELKKRGMYTDPKLTTEMPLDRGITFYLKGRRAAKKAETQTKNEGAGMPVEVIELAPGEAGEDGDGPRTVTIPQEPPIAPVGNRIDRSLIVGNLACAERVPEQIVPTASINQALTRMALFDYSQLVVTTSPREVKGLISYKSVAQAYFLGQPKIVGDCLDASVPVVELDEPLLRVVGRFNEHDAVLIRRPDKTLAGIVTPADIATEFNNLAAPFLLIGQIEDQLRWLVQRNLSDLAEAFARVDTVPGITAPSVTELTMGDLHRLLDHEENWSKVGIGLDRAEFCRELDCVREIRNAVMHFRDVPDGALDRLKRFANVVKDAYLRSGKLKPDPRA